MIRNYAYNNDDDESGCIQQEEVDRQLESFREAINETNKASLPIVKK